LVVPINGGGSVEGHKNDASLAGRAPVATFEAFNKIVHMGSIIAKKNKVSTEIDDTHKLTKQSAESAESAHRPLGARP
jgi:hypothetical protein